MMARPTVDLSGWNVGGMCIQSIVERGADARSVWKMRIYGVSRKRSIDTDSKEVMILLVLENATLLQDCDVPVTKS